MDRVTNKLTRNVIKNITLFNCFEVTDTEGLENTTYTFLTQRNLFFVSLIRFYCETKAQSCINTGSLYKSLASPFLTTFLGPEDAVQL